MIASSNGRKYCCPKWSLDGSTIAFVIMDISLDEDGYNSIWLVDSDGTNMRMLHTIMSGYPKPDWSPDGTEIAFSKPLGEYEPKVIYTINKDGTELKQISSFE